MSVVVLMPAFNEGSKIGRLLDEMPGQVYGRSVIVVVVDDGSTDQTAEVAGHHGAVVVAQSPNQGKGAAICRGLDYLECADLDALVWMDADGQHLPESLPGVVAPVLFDGFDMCVGSRYLDSSQQSKAPWNRRLVRLATIRAVQRMTGYATTDPFSGYRSFSPRALEALRIEACGYEVELEACFAVAGAGLSFTEVPIPRIYGPQSSKMSYGRTALGGRLAVVSGYARTILHARRVLQLREKVTSGG